MTIVFASNYYNHHQHPLSQKLYELTGGLYTFVATSEMRADRRALGYGTESVPDYVLCAHKSEENYREAERRILEADVVIIGSAPEKLLRERRRAGKLILRYAERPLKKKTSLLKQLRMHVALRVRNPRCKPIYLLSASAYAPGDFRRFGVFGTRAFRWGYFPEAQVYDDIDALIAKKDPNKLLWAGRHIDWKHPDDAIRLAKRLRRDGYAFDLDIIGLGEMTDALGEMIRSEGLGDCVHLLGSMKPEEVRVRMESAGIYLFLSDKQEGWGAVLNEAMNSGCAVVASHAIGSAPYLIEHGQNGLLYRSGDVDMLTERVRHLLESPEEQRRLGKRAYRTVTETWNAALAAERLIELCRRLLAEPDAASPYADGPLSRADILCDDWM